jgi:hypothetical protein
MNPQVYYVLHVVSVLLLTGFTFQAFAHPVPERRSKILKLTGILGVIVLVAGFGLIAKLGHSYTEPWIIMKFVAWLGMSATAGMAFRKPEKAGFLTLFTSFWIILAVVAVYVVRTQA